MGLPAAQRVLDPLLGGGGGAASTKRRRQEHGQVAQLSKTVAQLASGLQQVQDSLSRLRAAKPKRAAKTTARSREGGHGLWDKLVPLFDRAGQERNPPCDPFLPDPLRERVVRTYAAASCLLRVRKQDARAFLDVREPFSRSIGIQTVACSGQPEPVTLRLQPLEAVRASPGLAGGKANRQLTSACALRLTGPTAGGAVEGGIAPR